MTLWIRSKSIILDKCKSGPRIGIGISKDCNVDVRFNFNVCIPRFLVFGIGQPPKTIIHDSCSHLLWWKYGYKKTLGKLCQHVKGRDNAFPPSSYPQDALFILIFYCFEFFSSCVAADTATINVLLCLLDFLYLRLIVFYYF